MSLEQPPLERQGQVQVERLIDEDGGRHAADEIEDLARRVASGYDGAPIQQYVPNLVYNEVKSRIAHDSA
jgi:hypothetical protein